MTKDEALKLALEALESTGTTNQVGGFTQYFDGRLVDKAITAIEQALAAPVQEPVAWRTFDGEGGYEYRTYDTNEDYADAWEKRNPNHKGWVEPLYKDPTPCQTCEALARTAMMDQTAHDTTPPAAQPAQEPVALRDALSGALSGAYICSRVWSAWRAGTMTEDDFQLADECDELLDELVAAVAFATPPAAQRPWVGLTDDELLDIADMAYANDLELLKNLQAKLKEKNHAKAITAALAMSHPIVVETINVLAEMSQRLQDENDELKAALAAEREACAKVCADLYKQWEDDLANVAVGEDDPEIPNWFDCKLAIEARSET